MLSQPEISKIERAGKISLPLCMRWRLAASIDEHVRTISTVQKYNQENAVLKQIASTMGSFITFLNNRDIQKVLFWGPQPESRRLVSDLENIQKYTAEWTTESAKAGRPPNLLRGLFLIKLASIFSSSGGGSTAVVKDLDGYRRTDGFIDFAMAVFNTMPEDLRPSSSMALASHWERIHPKVNRPQKRPSMNDILRA